VAIGAYCTPTPLLDWTYSPFIAAFFAFKYASRAGPSVRVFMLDRELRRKDWIQLQKVAPARLHFSILDAVALTNPRMVRNKRFQPLPMRKTSRAISRKKRLNDPGRQYLHVVDLPLRQRDDALRELRRWALHRDRFFRVWMARAPSLRIASLASSGGTVVPPSSNCCSRLSESSLRTSFRWINKSF
jgi:hypothetical protein